MKHNLSQIVAITAVAGTLALAVSQAAALCYTPVIDPPTQSGLNCGLYTVCPGRTLCGLGGTGLPGNIVMVTLACTDYVGGTGTVPNCTGGVALLTTTATVTVPVQSCPGNCKEPGGGSQIG